MQKKESIEMGRHPFTLKLLNWNQKQNKRTLPWKSTKDPYKIWLSEIILQQTRVEQGTSYYLKLTEQFPTVHHLANATEDELMKCWQGLGYYRRARHLHESARFISKELKGKFPTSYEDILALKGVGAYTAAAIASFAYNLPYAAVDGNVYRVLARYFGISTPIDTTKGQKQFSALAGQLLDRTNSAEYNQAIMDFGNQVCKPKQPYCKSCLLRVGCLAHQNGQVTNYPVKSKKIKRKERFFAYLVIRIDQSLFIQKRSDNDIWRGLFEFPALEFSAQPSEKQIAQKLFQDFGVQPTSILKISDLYKQTLTHRTVFGQFIHLQLNAPARLKKSFRSMIQINLSEISNFAFPKIISCYLEDKVVT